MCVFYYRECNIDVIFHSLYVNCPCNVSLNSTSEEYHYYIYGEFLLGLQVVQRLVKIKSY